jgi:hypothetical protein
MKNKLSEYIDTLWLALGEIIVSALVFLGYMVLKRFEIVQLDRDYTVITGALLGSLVSVINFLILSVSVTRAINKIAAARGNLEMDEEAIEKFKNEYNAGIQGAMAKSYLLRLILMIGSLVLAMLSGYFNPLATAIPLVMYRPVLYFVNLVKSKFSKKGGTF